MFSNIITNAAAVLESKGIKCNMYNGCKMDSALQHVALEEPIVFKSEDIPVGCEVLYECYTDENSNDPEFYTFFSDPTQNKKIKRFVTLLIKKGSVDYKNPMVRRFIFIKAPKVKKEKKDKRITITCKDVGHVTWKALLSFCEAMSYASAATSSIYDDDEDEPILNEIKGPELAVSTRFG